MPVRVPIASDVLKWAQVHSGKSDEALVRKFGKWTEWLDGTANPTLSDVEKLANFTKVPFGFFFLENPPSIKLPIPDFRLGSEGLKHAPSPELLDSIYASEQRQQWYHDYAIRNGLDAVPAVGAGRGRTATEAAQIATDLFEFSVSERAKDKNKARNHLLSAFEEMGGLAVFAGIVGNNTHRPLDRQEFRGFTLTDQYAPLIFVNANDTLSGQIFTFFHEFGHVLRAESGVSNDDPTEPSEVETEKWCNALAAEVLVPEADIRKQVNGLAINEDLLDDLSTKYLVSTLVVLLRLRDIGILDRRDFRQLYEKELVRVQDALANQSDRSGGGNHWNNQRFRVGERLGRAVIAETRAGHTSYTDAFKLLNISSVSQMEKLAEQFGVS